MMKKYLEATEIIDFHDAYIETLAKTLADDAKIEVEIYIGVTYL
ncbi:hypothetical protein ACFLRS_01365 [Campylobacterota bacterium]